jgi:lipoprotein Spr
VKNISIFVAFAIFAMSCDSLKPAASKPDKTDAAKSHGSLLFIDNVSLNPEGHKDRTGASLGPNNEPPIPTVFSRSTYNPAIEKYPLLKFKYAILMDATVEEMDNERLLSYIDEWYGTRYRYGGIAKDGIDCSAFASSLIAAVYGINNLPRMAKDQYNVSRKVNRNELQEGDLVFFHTMGRRKSVTHVGVYLRNNRFIHASVLGVIISSLDEVYYAQHFIGAGRVI